MPLTATTKEKTTFICREGLFQFNTILMGLCNETHTFQRLMDMVLGKLRWECVLVYIDDVNIYLRSFKDHMRDLQGVFEKIWAVSLKLKAKKCVIGLHELVYVGHVVSAAGLRLDPVKIQAVAKFPRLVNLECNKSFIGLVNYYPQFVQRFALLAAPLYQLLKKNVPFIWEERTTTSLWEA